eukprot:m51a1_g10100 hypothetical protein (1055) ;mRNA; f:87354-96328
MALSAEVEISLAGHNGNALFSSGLDYYVAPGAVMWGTWAPRQPWSPDYRVCFRLYAHRAAPSANEQPRLLCVSVRAPLQAYPQANWVALWADSGPAQWGQLGFMATRDQQSLDPQHSQLWSVYVGIDNYTRARNLWGAANDVARMREAVQPHLPPHVGRRTTLLNGEATRQRMSDALSEAVGSARPGDVVLFYYSGLGTTVYDTRNKAVVESLCPVTLSTDSRSELERKFFTAAELDFIAKGNIHRLVADKWRNAVTGAIRSVKAAREGKKKKTGEKSAEAEAEAEAEVEAALVEEPEPEEEEHTSKPAGPIRRDSLKKAAVVPQALPSPKNVSADKRLEAAGVLTAIELKNLFRTAMFGGVTVYAILDTCFTPATPAQGLGDRYLAFFDEWHWALYRGQDEIPWVAFAPMAQLLNTVVHTSREIGSRELGQSRSICVGSVLDTLHVGAIQKGTGATGSERWVDIARGAQAFGVGIVEASKKASATRDMAIDRAALQALEAMTREQWAAVARQAIELEPRGMCDVVDSVAGGLDTSPARRHLLMRSLCDTALVNALLATESNWRVREAELVQGAGGDTARLRQALEALPYLRKLQLLDATRSSSDGGKIQVVPGTTASSEASTATWLPAGGNLEDVDNVHAFATVRSVVDAVERVLRGTAGIDQEECMQELEALDEGRSWGERTSKGLRWQAGQRLVVDTRATGVTQPMYSRRAGALLFPLLRCSDGGAAGAWAEGIEERPEGGVLHEAFADLVGLLVGTGTAAVSGAVAAQTRCDTGLPRQRADGRRWSSREVSAMVNSAVWAAVASELAKRCHRSRAEDKEGKEARRTGPAEDAAEVLSQLAKQALAALVAACMRPEFKDTAPTLVDFCDALVCEGSQDGFHEALRCELEKRFLLTSQWKKPFPRLAKGSIEHTSATVSGFLLLASSKDEPTAQTTQPTAGRTVECPVSRQLWATLRTGAQQALDDTEDEAGAWEALVETWGRVEREAAGQVFGERRMWSAIVVEAAEEPTAEGIRSVRKLVLSLEYVMGCCNESPSLALWRRVLASFSNTI